jgi:hypothetical protein
MISDFTMSECAELITSAYNSVSWYRNLAEKSELNRDYWIERAGKAEKIADKLNEVYRKEFYPY